MTAGPVREIRDENGDVIARVWEESSGTVLASLKCELAEGTRELLEYPDNWKKLSDRKLFALGRSGELLR